MVLRAVRGVKAARRLDRTALSGGMRAAIRFGMGFVLAQGRVFGEATPFGVALAAACGTEGALGICGAAGAAVGALAAWRLGDGLKYVAAVVLALVAAKAFAGTKVAEARFFGAVVAAGSLSVVGFVFVAADGFPLAATLAYICEIALAGAAAFVIPHAMRPQTGECSTREQSLRSASRLLFAALALLGLSSVPFFAGMTVGRTAATVLVLSAAASGGMGAGAAAGVALGIVFDVGGGGGFYAMCYGAAGLLAGVAGGGSRLYASLAYVFASAVAALMDGTHFSVLYETFVASVMFIMIPEGRLRIVDFLAPEEVGSTQRVERRELAAKYRALGDVFSETARSIVPAVQRTVTPDRIFLRAAARVCRGCALCAVCWEREREETFSGLRGCYSKILSRGGVETGDLPPSFRARCLRPEDFRNVLGEEFRIGQMERRRASEDMRRRKLSALRLGDTASLMSETAAEIAAGPEFDASAQRAARRALLAENCAADLSAYRLGGGRLCVELDTLRLPGSTREALERALGVRFRTARRTDDGHILLVERGKFEIAAAAATRRRRGSGKNGDCGTYFDAPHGRFCCVLADGMGSGAAAAEEAERTVRLAQQLVEGGVSAARTAEMVSDLAAERDQAVFATLDLLVVDDWTAHAELLKLGAAASYLRVGGRVVTAEGAVSPALAGVRPRRTSLDLGGCDLILMLTDGVCDGEGDDSWLRGMIEDHEGSAEELVRAVLTEASKRTDESDDMTVVALELER